MEFEWDNQKSALNQEKHGVSFELAAQIWESTHLEMQDLAYSEDGEIRNATIGWIEQQLYVAIWTRRRNKIRIISVRKARDNEENIFKEKIQNGF